PQHLVATECAIEQRHIATLIHDCAAIDERRAARAVAGKSTRANLERAVIADRATLANSCIIAHQHIRQYQRAKILQRVRAAKGAILERNVTHIEPRRAKDLEERACAASIERN